MSFTSRVTRLAVTACVMTVMAGGVAIAQDSVKAGHKEPGPKPPKKFEALQNKGGNNPGPKPLPKKELFLLQGSSGAYLLDRAQLDKVRSEGPPTCKVKCASGVLNGARVSFPESVLQRYKLSPPVANYFKENAGRFGANVAKWTPPETPDAARALQGAASVELVAPQY